MFLSDSCPRILHFGQFLYFSRPHIFMEKTEIVKTYLSLLFWELKITYEKSLHSMEDFINYKQVLISFYYYFCITNSATYKKHVTN